NPRGMRNYWKTHYMNSLSDGAIRTIVECYASVPSPFSHAVVYAIGGGRAGRVPDDATAVAYRNMRYALVLISMWENPADDERNEEHTSELQSRGHLVCRLLLEKKNKQHVH